VRTRNVRSRTCGLLGTEYIINITIGLLSSSLAPSTYANYDITLRELFTFCDNEEILSLQGTPATMVRNTAWFGLLGTIAAGSMPIFRS
jgi:hypothetical protein